MKKEATTWLMVAAVSIFACCAGCLLELIAAVMCFLAMQAAEQGNVADAEAKLKWGKILTIAGIVFGVLSNAAIILYNFVWNVSSAP